MQAFILFLPWPTFSPSHQLPCPLTFPLLLNHSSSSSLSPSSVGAGFHQEAWAAGERSYSGEESRDLQPALYQVHYKKQALNCTLALNLKWALVVGPNFVKWCTCPKCVFDGLFWVTVWPWGWSGRWPNYLNIASSPPYESAFSHDLYSRRMIEFSPLFIVYLRSAQTAQLQNNDADIHLNEESR